MWNNQINFQMLKTLSKWIAVIAFIGNKPYGALFGSASTSSWNLHRIKGFFGELYFRRAMPRQGCFPEEYLGRRPPPSTSFLCPFWFSRRRRPFFCRCKAAIDKGFFPVQHSFLHRAWTKICAIHRATHLGLPKVVSRRQQVDGLGYRSGKSCQRAPVRRTQRMPSSTCRLSIGGRPPFGFALGSGSSGSSSFHWSSFMNRVYLAIGSPPNSLIHKNTVKV